MKCEIEFLPVGTGAKAGDAIVIRYGEPQAWELMVVDGGTLESGQAIVDHIRAFFPTSHIAHVVLSHPDGDHASGLRTVLEQLPVRKLWLHVPWLHATDCRQYFQDKRWTSEGLAAAIRKEYQIIAELVDIAIANNVDVFEPFAGDDIGPFTVLGPHRSVYELLMPQFARTPQPDQSAIEAQRLWISKESPPNALSVMFEKALTKLQKWVPETWEGERLKDGGVTSATNESSVVLYGNFDRGRVLLTADVGRWGLSFASSYAKHNGKAMAPFNFVQVPHHGSRRNVGPAVLNELIGPIVPKNTTPFFSAFVSAPPDDDTHPRKMVVNAFLRRGGHVIATQGDKKIYYGGFPARSGYSTAQPLAFSNQVEEYDE